MVCSENWLQLTFLIPFCMFPLYLLDQVQSFCESDQYGSVSGDEVPSNEKYQADKMLRTLFIQPKRMYFFLSCLILQRNSEM